MQTKANNFEIFIKQNMYVIFKISLLWFPNAKGEKNMIL